MRRVEMLACCGLLLVMAVASAWPGASQQLPSAQRAALQVREHAWEAMTAAQQRALRQRQARWRALPAAVQRDRREQWQAWQALPREQQQQLDAAAATFDALPAQQRGQWRARFDLLDRSEQRGWMLGPRLGADYMRLQPLLAQVPADEREPLLALLRTLSANERNDLAMLAQRIAPQQRDALRRGLLATSAGNRAAWLQLRLEQ